MSGEPRYIPAAGRAAFTRLYDPALALTVRERRFRSLLEDQVLSELPSRSTVIDVGCGTGTFAISLARRRPDLRVVGIDGDETILERARAKDGADRVEWMQALAGELPIEDSSADAVTMSLLLHHLTPADKGSALEDAHRILKAGGKLHIADWGLPHGPGMRAAFFLLQALDGFENTRDHAAGKVPTFVRRAGFGAVTTTARLRTVWGSLELTEAIKPAA